MTGQTQIEPGEGHKRIAVVGTSGSGKTTFAAEIAKRLGIRHVETDALSWGPKWRELPRPVFLARLGEVLAGDAWVLDGNYGSVRGLVWGRADTVVWLDYRLPVILARLARRTIRRVRRGDVLWAGNRESVERALSPKDSILAWAMRTHGGHRRHYPRLFRRAAYAHLRVVRLRSPAQAQEWLSTL